MCFLLIEQCIRIEAFLNLLDLYMAKKAQAMHKYGGLVVRMLLLPSWTPRLSTTVLSTAKHVILSWRRRTFMNATGQLISPRHGRFSLQSHLDEAVRSVTELVTTSLFKSKNKTQIMITLLHYSVALLLPLLFDACGGGQVGESAAFATKAAHIGCG